MERKGEPSSLGRRCSEVLRHLSPSIDSEGGTAPLDLDAPLTEIGVDSLARFPTIPHPTLALALDLDLALTLTLTLTRTLTGAGRHPATRARLQDR